METYARLSRSGKIDRLISSDDKGQRNTLGVSIASDIEVSDVSYHIDGKTILDDISFSIAAGQVLCLLGPSGSGKTTLLRSIAGLVQPQRGLISFDGRPVQGGGRFVPPEKRNVGFVFQDFALFPHLNVLENVSFGLTRLKSHEARKQALHILERVGMGNYYKSYPHKLSGGEQQRVALARALAPRPGIILMDEPFSGLDARLRDSIREQTVDLFRDTSATVIVVTHDPEEALRISDRIVLMHAGKVVQNGSCETLYNHPSDRFCAEFFSELNTVSGVVEGGVVQTPLGSVSANNFENGQSVEVCARHSAVRLHPIADPVQKPASYGIRIGKILGRRFIGNIELLEFSVHGSEDIFKARIRTQAIPPDTKYAQVELDCDQVYVFSKS